MPPASGSEGEAGRASPGGTVERSPAEREGPTLDAKSTIVVGVDGSTASARALEWATDRARLTRSRLRVVMAWEPGATEEWPAAEREAGDEGLASRIMLRGILAQAIEETSELEVSSAAVEGPAAGVLLHEALDASLLVLGDRGIGGFAGLRLGSVGLQCVMHAPCTVVIVRPKSESRGTPGTAPLSALGAP